MTRSPAAPGGGGAGAVIIGSQRAAAAGPVTQAEAARPRRLESWHIEAGARAKALQPETR